MDQPSGARLEEERRRLWDRRSPEPLRLTAERRSGERRRSALAPPAERRSGPERRQASRRHGAERRTHTDRRRGVRTRDTLSPFADAEVAELSARFAASGPVTCPVCGSRVSLGPTRQTESQTFRLVVCVGCSRGAVLPDPGTARVLVVGDNAALRDILRAPLERAGHDVTEAADAGVGLAANEANPADVILLDIQGTGRIGAPEFLRRLRSSTPDARVVALLHGAATREPDPAAGARALGVAATILLPVSREDLLKTVYAARATD